MWSIAVVTFTLLYGVHPFACTDQKVTYKKI